MSQTFRSWSVKLFEILKQMPQLWQLKFQNILFGSASVQQPGPPICERHILIDHRRSAPALRSVEGALNHDALWRPVHHLFEVAPLLVKPDGNNRKLKNYHAWGFCFEPILKWLINRLIKPATLSTGDRDELQKLRQATWQILRLNEGCRGVCESSTISKYDALKAIFSRRLLWQRDFYT